MYNSKYDIVVFHGGCLGCTQQHVQKEGTRFCMGCQYFDADWDLPDLSSGKQPPPAGIERSRLIKLYGDE